MHQNYAKVGGLEPAATLHSNIVALADIVDVHRDTGISPWNAQHGSGYSLACPKKMLWTMHSSSIHLSQKPSQTPIGRSIVPQTEAYFAYQVQTAISCMAARSHDAERSPR